MASTLVHNAYSPRGIHSAAPASHRGRSRRLGTVEFATLLLIAVLLVVGLLATRQHATFNGPTETLQVQAGDTLWSIAQAHPAAGLSTAQNVEMIIAGNHLNGDIVSPGLTITVPSHESQGELALR